PEAPPPPLGPWADALDVAVACVDEDGKVWANAAFRRLAAEMAGDGAEIPPLDVLRRISFPDTGARAEDVLAVVAGGRAEFEQVGTLCTAQGSRRYLRVRTARAVGGTVVELADVTDREEARREVRLQTEVHRILAGQSRLFFDDLDRIAAAACRNLGWEVAILWLPTSSGTLHRAHVHRPAGTCDAVLSTILASDEVTHVADEAFAMRRPVAARLPGHAGGRLLAIPLGTEGEVVAVLEVFARRPVTDTPTARAILRTAGAQLASSILRERAEAKVRAADTRLREITATLSSIMECAPVFILTTDREGTITYINRTDPPGGEDDVVGRSWLSFLPEQDHDAHRARLARVLDGAHEEYQTTSVTADGTPRVYRCHIGPLRRDDAVVGAVIVAQDVTAAERREQEYQAAQRLAAVGTLAAGIAHEINTPVQFVSDSVHFLREAALDAFVLIDALMRLHHAVTTGQSAETVEELAQLASEAAEEADLEYLREEVPPAFDRCIDGLERVAKIVRSMKEFSHPSADKPEPADLNRAIESTLTIARNEYKYVAELETHLDDLPPVTCHVGDVNQVVLNLVVNAAHAIADVVKDSGAKGTISVRTYRDGDFAHIEIADTGGGIPSEIADRVFDPFFTTKEVGKGTGQGLALAWRVVRDRHQGEIWFDSTPGRGTTFHIKLPIAGPPKADDGAPEEVAA
ncbi:MAG: PAS domain S-box protein, partial [Deltaproteobacteria bacterium]